MKDLPELHVLSLMSGTSLDGIDGVLARFRLQNGQLQWEVTDRLSLPYSDTLRERLLRAIQPEGSSVVLLTQLHTEIGLAYAELVQAVQARHRLDLVALSGQTVYHIPTVDPSRDWHTVSTLQIGEASRVAAAANIPVLSDFRQADMAAGGGGAPMVSFGDLWLFSKPGQARSIHNLGGISNLTYLPANGSPEAVFAFDTGPANCLIDEATKRYFGLEFDEAGRLAKQGNIQQSLLNSLLDESYYPQKPPKTTGRELFALREIDKRLDLSAYKPHDVLATLTALTAETIAQAYKDFVLPLGLDEVLVAGGGAHNPTLMTLLQERLPLPVLSFEELGWQSKDREALAFGVMAYFGFHGLTNTLPSATGARRAVVAGKLSRP